MHPQTAFYRAAKTKGWKVILGREPMILSGPFAAGIVGGVTLEQFGLDEAKKTIQDALAKHDEI